MKIKVCGLRQPENIKALGELPIDFVGFIFYPHSKRFVAKRPDIQLPSTIQRVGVFVNASLSDIEARAVGFALDYVQLHGDESPSFCQQIADKGLKVIKAFAVDADFDFEQLNAYEAACTFFLLDTKGADYGGNGVAFDWEILTRYASKTPFLLSGGIGPESVAALRALELPTLYGVDINSRFEEAPALKNVSLVHHFAQQLQAI